MAACRRTSNVCVLPREGRAPHATASLCQPEQLAQEIAALTSLSVKALKERWRWLYGSEPHRRMRLELLTRAVAYRLQERTCGRNVSILACS